MRLLILLTLTLTLILPLGLNAQDAFIAQDFEEATTDEWSYTPEPEALTRVILWGRMNEQVGNTSAHNGDWYWATWDLDNTEHSLVFDSVQLPFGEVYTLHFYYYSVNLNPVTDFVKYSIEYGEGSEWNSWITLEPNAGAWTQVSIDIPASERQVRLKVSAQYDGFSKYVHWDNFLIDSQPAPLTAPVVSNLIVNQRNDGSKLVDISYDLFDANNDFCDISLQVSADEGNSYNYIADSANLSGDAGEGVTPGLNKEIIWDAGSESQAFSADNYFVKITAEDNTYLQIATPVISPEGGSYDEAQTITITCQTPDVDIYYTLDGNDPDESSTLYTAPFNLGDSAVVKAKAYKVDWEDSEIVAVDYVINTDFVLVDGGTFTMGDTRGGGQSDELPTHQVTLSPFYMGKYEVSHTKYIEFLNSYGVASNGSYNGVELIDMDGSYCAVGYSSGNFYFSSNSYATNSECPVIEVTWYGSAVYSNWLSEQEGLTPCYNTTTWTCNTSANGYRLPTESEWEYAARGGTNNPDYLYSGSNDINSVAWYISNSGSTTHNVGTKAPNSLGIYDMSGNVWEWCNDWYGSYSSSAQTDPVGPNSGSSRVLRGGSWGNNASGCRVALRAYNYPSNSNFIIGFRISRAVE